MTAQNPPVTVLRGSGSTERSPTPEIVIRASALSGWADCPRRGAARLFWREIAAMGFRLRAGPRGIGAAIGTALHRAAEVSLKEKAETGRLPPSTLTADCAAQTLSASLRDGEIAFDRVTTNPVEGEVQAVMMARTWHRNLAPAIDPVLIEEPMSAEVAPGLVLEGRPDLIAREPQGVRDLKGTAGRPMSHAPQLGAYALLARSNGLDIEEAAIDTVRRVPVGKPQPAPTTQHVRLAEAETAAASIIKHIAGDLATFRDGDRVRRIAPGDPWAFAANPQSVLCSPKYCPAFGTEFCREGDAAKAHQ